MNNNSYFMNGRTGQTTQSINEEDEEKSMASPISEYPSKLADEENLQLDLLEQFHDDFEPADDLIDTPNRQFWHKMQQKADHAWNMHQALESEKSAWDADETAPLNLDIHGTAKPQSQSAASGLNATPQQSHSAKLQQQSPIAFDRLRIFADTASPEEYDEMLHLPPVQRLRKLYEVAKDKKPRWGSEPLSVSRAKKKPQESTQQTATTNSINGDNQAVTPKSATTPAAPAAVSVQSNENLEKEAPRNDIKASSSKVYMIVEHSPSNQSIRETANTDEASSKNNPIDSNNPRSESDFDDNQEGILLHANEYNEVFDLYTSNQREERAMNQEYLKKHIGKQMQKMVESTEVKTGFGATEQEAQLVRDSIVEVQYEEDGKFFPVPSSFDPQKNSFYSLKVDTRRIYGASLQDKAREMVDLLFRLRSEEGDAQEILDMSDKDARMRLIKQITDGHTYENTPISIPTLNLPSNVIRTASPEYVDASPEERVALETGNQIHYVDAPAADVHNTSPFVIIKRISKGFSNYEANDDNRKAKGYEIEVLFGADLEVDYDTSDSAEMLYAITQSVHGGSSDGSLPAYKNAQGEIIRPGLSRAEYAREARAHMDKSPQAVLHEGFHRRTNTSMLVKQTSKINPETGEHQRSYENVSKVPGVPSEVHAAKVVEMVNAVHALKWFVKNNFEWETLSNVDDFKFLYESIWSPDDASDDAAQARARIPRDARILFSVYELIQKQHKIKQKALNMYTIYRDEIHEKHPEIKTFNDIYAQMPELLKTLSGNPSNKKVEIHEALLQIIRAFYWHRITNPQNSEAIFLKWLEENKIFEQAANKREEVSHPIV